MFQTTRKAFLAAALALVSGCASPPPPPPLQSAVPTLSRSFDLVDPLGNRAGKLVLEPVGNGVVYDSGGRVIGTVIPPN